MPKRISFMIQKGGSSKTTSTVAVAEILAAAGYKVLVVDLDSQGNATKMIARTSIYQFSSRSIMEAIQYNDAEEYIVPINDNLSLLPAEDRLATFSRHIYTSRTENPYAILKRLLEPIEDRYDYVFVDVGPSLGDLMINAIVYVDHIVVPIDMGDLAMDALLRFTEFVDETRGEGHTHAQISGILLTMKSSRSRYEKEISEGIREVYGDLVFKTEIRRRIRLKEMSAKGIDLEDKAMEDYYALAEEIINMTDREEDQQ